MACFGEVMVAVGTPVGVFEDGAVAAELADAGGVEDGHFLAQLRLVLVGSVHLRLAVDVGIGVGQARGRDRRVQQAVAERFERSCLPVK
jgi:hypothetical protein